MITPRTARIIWPEGPARLLVSVALVFLAAILYVAIPPFAASPYLYSAIVCLIFVLGLWGFSKGYEQLSRRVARKRYEVVREKTYGELWRSVLSDGHGVLRLENVFLELETNWEAIIREFPAVVREFRNSAAHQVVAIITDDLVTSAILAKAFYNFGFRIRGVVIAIQKSSEIAREFRRSLPEKPDLVLLDVKMEEVSASLLLDALRKHPLGEKISFISVETVARDPSELRFTLRSLLADRPAGFSQQFLSHMSRAANLASAVKAFSRQKPSP